METTAAALVLLAALLHASWNVLVKAEGDGLTAIAGVSAGGAAMAAALVPFVGLPDTRAWPFMATALAFQFAYKRLLAEAYRHGDLSRIYPLVRGLPPLAVAALGWIVVGERLSLAETGAIALVAAGVLTLVFGARTALDLRPVGYALATAATIAAYTLLDGLGARASGNAIAYVACLIALDGAIFAAYIAVARGPATLRAALARRRTTVIGGACAFASYALVVWAFTMAPIAVVAALRETSVVIAAVFGALLLKEPFGLPRIGAAALIAAGLALLKLNAG
jgi:drug/metabolite transporter (DMT)-like permease